MDGEATRVAIGDFFFVSRERRFVFVFASERKRKKETNDRSIDRSVGRMIRDASYIRR